MLETHAKVGDAAALALARLQTAADRWYQRGYQDGQAWAAQKATREDLALVDEVKTLGHLERVAFTTLFAENSDAMTGVNQDASRPAASEGRTGHPEGEWDYAKIHVNTVDEGAYRAGWCQGAAEVARAVLQAIQVGSAAVPNASERAQPNGIRFRRGVGGPPRVFNNEDAERASRRGSAPMPGPVMPPSGVTLSETRENE